jgi:hypothetical protein
MIMTTPAASLQGFRKGIQKWGPDNETMIYWDGRMDSKVLALTPNTTVVYTFMWIDLKDGLWRSRRSSRCEARHAD